MTIKLFHRDQYQTEFQARVIEQRERPDGTWEVYLDRTLFYPTSGGQPHDTGFLDGIRVMEVLETETPMVSEVEPGRNPGLIAHIVGAPVPTSVTAVEPGRSPGTILHVLEKSCAAPQVTGRIDWPRRFDHMQQHAGQHILSGAFFRLLGTQTVGFHLGKEEVTIDLALPALAPAEAAAAEDLANDIVFENRAILAHWVAPEELVNYPLRKPPARKENIRLVEVEDFDYSPCGGTHPRRAGEIGLIKILGIERVRKDIRVHFVCGQRALQDYRLKNGWVTEVGARLSLPGPEIVAGVERLLTSLKEKDKALEELREDLLQYQVEGLLARRKRIGPEPISQSLRLSKRMDDASRNPAGKLPPESPPAPEEGLGLTSQESEPPEKVGERDDVAYYLINEVLADRLPAELRTLATRLVAKGRTVAVLASEKEAEQLAQLVVARSQDVPLDANALLKKGLLPMEGRGGGSPFLAQGAGKREKLSQARQAIDEAVRQAVLPRRSSALS